ncbi:hypothetical protein TIFTF001_019986 [Ficus carica]|uniref:Uncharacterized protein n=1 Tax=Ficus carica TaxID=3494 RepID=A0AA88DC69_FICCA|nr:hypothetical protein TIFTF001_019986 [Ficus carica]
MNCGKCHYSSSRSERRADIWCWKGVLGIL